LSENIEGAVSQVHVRIRGRDVIVVYSVSGFDLTPIPLVILHLLERHAMKGPLLKMKGEVELGKVNI
jgi:hypothetical protein